uniref:Putative secreted protein n=1 Tax=Anopheles darlingi TaxID=43151 RepID=A0A2M4DMS7_ANODA
MCVCVSVCLRECLLPHYQLFFSYLILPAPTALPTVLALPHPPLVVGVGWSLVNGMFAKTNSNKITAFYC